MRICDLTATRHGLSCPLRFSLALIVGRGKDANFEPAEPEAFDVDGAVPLEVMLCFCVTEGKQHPRREYLEWSCRLLHIDLHHRSS